MTVMTRWVESCKCLQIKWLIHRSVESSSTCVRDLDHCAVSTLAQGKGQRLDQ